MQRVIKIQEDSFEENDSLEKKPKTKNNEVKLHLQEFLLIKCDYPELNRNIYSYFFCAFSCIVLTVCIYPLSIYFY